MLTTSIKGRTLDYSRVVGGRLFRGIVNATIGEKDNVYVVLSECPPSTIAYGSFKLFVLN